MNACVSSGSGTEVNDSSQSLPSAAAATNVMHPRQWFEPNAVALQCNGVWFDHFSCIWLVFQTHTGRILPPSLSNQSFISKTWEQSQFLPANWIFDRGVKLTRRYYPLLIL